MALWDNITKKATAVTEKAVSQARSLSEMAKLHNQIADAEKTITDCYTQIGKLYATAHPHDYEPEYGDCITAIARCEELIGSLRKQLQDLKGIAVCPGCGAEVARDAAFCSACGAAMPKEEPREAEVVTQEAPAEACPDCPSEEPEAESGNDDVIHF